MKELKECLKNYLKENKINEINYEQLHALYKTKYPDTILNSILVSFLNKLQERDEVEFKGTKKQSYLFKSQFFTNIEVNKQLRRKMIRFIF